MEKLFYLFLLIGAAAAQSCIQCNSNQNAMCATAPGNLMAKTCQYQNATCYTRVYLSQTIRGCSSDLNATDLQACISNYTCSSCSGLACNNRIFPSSRPTCYQCDSRISGNCSEISFATPVPCSIYREDDRCFIFKSSNQNTFVRGCLTSSNNLCRNISQCYVCNGFGCNNLAGNSTYIPEGNSATLFALSSTLFFLVLAFFFMKLN